VLSGPKTGCWHPMPRNLMPRHPTPRNFMPRHSWAPAGGKSGMGRPPGLSREPRARSQQAGGGVSVLTGGAPS